MFSQSKKLKGLFHYMYMYIAPFLFSSKTIVFMDFTYIYICIHLYILIWTHIATFCDTFRICREILKVKILDYLHVPMNPVTKILNAILTTFCPKNGQEHSSEFIKQLLYFAPSTCEFLAASSVVDTLHDYNIKWGFGLGGSLGQKKKDPVLFDPFQNIFDCMPLWRSTFFIAYVLLCLQCSYTTRLKQISIILLLYPYILKSKLKTLTDHEILQKPTNMRLHFCNIIPIHICNRIAKHRICCQYRIKTIR